MFLRSSTVVFALASLLAFHTKAINAAIYMRMGSIRGESTAAEYEEWIVLDSVDWNFAPEEALPGDKGVNLSIAAHWDISSVEVANLHATGAVQDRVAIALVMTSNTGTLPVATYRLSGVTITDFEANLSDDSTVSYKMHAAGLEVSSNDQVRGFGDVAGRRLRGAEP